VTVWDESSRRAHWRNRATAPGTSGQPFFAVFNHTGTHESQAFPDARRRPEVVSQADVPIPPFYPDTPDVRDALARTYNNIAAMDAWVGQRLAELEDADLLDNTIVFFFSDHGVGLPRGKRDLYDTGVRVPLLVRFPDGHGAGTTTDRIVQFNDFGPTVLSLAGIEPEPRLDGTAFLGPHAGEPRTLAYLHADRMDVVHDTQRAVSDGRFKYIRNYRPDLPLMYRQDYRNRLAMMSDIDRLKESGPLAPEQWQMAASIRPIHELYDTREDPWEVRNLASDPAHQDRLARMRAEMEAWIERTGDLGFVLPETVLVNEHLWPPDGIQPETAPPIIDIADGLVTVSCDTEGASIGHRMGDDGPWSVYTGPFDPQGRGTLQVVTHRIGWHASRRTIRIR
jgi:N-sulfoglucosamine sulfohydrolase